MLFYHRGDMLNYHGICNKPEANEVSLSSIPKGEKEIAYLSFNVEGYSSYCKEYREYWAWVDERNENRFSTNMNHGKNYDSKNMMHTFRLLQVAEEILRDGKLNVKRPNREELLSVKRGDKDYDILLAKADRLMDSIQLYPETSILQDKPNMKKIESILVEMREKLYG